MQKSLKILMMGVLCFLILFMATGCFNKTALSSSDFKTRMEDKGYTVEDATNQISSDNINQVYIAKNEEEQYQIEFYDLSTSDTAYNFYNNAKINFENSKSGISSDSYVNIGNHSKYSLSTNNKFNVVSRIDNTVIYISVPDSYKSTVKDLLKDIGY